jgi:hypothetical protein
MGTKFWKVLCDEHGIGGSSEYCGENDAHLGRINGIYNEALDGKCDANNPVNHTRGQKLGQGHNKRVEPNYSDLPPPVV